MSDTLIVGIIGIITTIVSGWTSWFFARKKYNSEVDSNLIKNMQESLEFYKSLSNDAKDRLEEVLEENKELRKDVNFLRDQMIKMSTSICVDLSCQLRRLDLSILHLDRDEEDKPE